MKYLINEHTKEHLRWTHGIAMPMSAPGYKTVEADSEGWIPHTGTECPLPDDVWCEMQFSTGGTSSRLTTAKEWDWASKYITHYRPILEPEKVQEPMSTTDWNKAVRDSTDKLLAEAGYQPDSSVRHGLAMMNFDKPIPAPDYDPRSVSFNLIDRLKAAHEAAQTIPDLEAQLRQVLAGMGYDLVSRNPFTQQRHGTGE